MSNDLLLIKYEGAEKDFVNRTGTNRGFIPLYRMISRCIFLTEGELKTYIELNNYGAMDGRIFPSHARMALNIGFHQRTIARHIDMLAEMGFLTKIRRGNQKTNEYIICELHKVPVLLLSEHLHEHVNALIENDHTKLDDYAQARAEFAKTDLYSYIRSHPSEALDLAGKCTELFVSLCKGAEVAQPAPEPKQAAAPAPSHLPRLVNIETESGGRPVAGAPRTSGRTKTAIHDKSVEQWGVPDLVKYFSEQYVFATKRVYNSNKLKDLNKISGVIKKDPKYFTPEKIKQFIKVYFDEYGQVTKNLSTEHFAKVETINKIKNFIEYNVPIRFQQSTPVNETTKPNTRNLSGNRVEVEEDLGGWG